MIFPKVDQVPRHPSQLYEAGLEGVILFLVLYFFARQEKVRCRLGMLSGIFLIGYAIARMIGEQFREPEVTLPNDITTWGQWLSVPMLLYGIYLVWRAKPVAPRPAATADAAKVDAAKP
jgi:phosphatidylglycerol:prolipoprotein diacylglycerol transferase